MASYWIIEVIKVQWAVPLLLHVGVNEPTLGPLTLRMRYSLPRSRPWLSKPSRSSKTNSVLLRPASTLMHLIRQQASQPRLLVCCKYRNMWSTRKQNWSHRVAVVLVTRLDDVFVYSLWNQELNSVFENVVVFSYHIELHLTLSTPLVVIVFGTQFYSAYVDFSPSQATKWDSSQVSGTSAF